LKLEENEEKINKKESQNKEEKYFKFLDSTLNKKNIPIQGKDTQILNPIHEFKINQINNNKNSDCFSQEYINKMYF